MDDGLKTPYTGDYVMCSSALFTDSDPQNFEDTRTL